MQNNFSCTNSPVSQKLKIKKIKKKLRGHVFEERARPRKANHLSQMPIVDGLASTKLIRAFERSAAHGHLRKRIPIFAVSASLMEKDRAIYTDAGFDGWILKPIDFKRLHVLLEGITSYDVRGQCLYQPGEWERGGWLVHQPTD